MSLTAQRLRELLQYAPESGVFSRDGEDVGCRNGDGYIVIRVDGKNYLAHRLAFLYMTGSWPAMDVDHKSGVRCDNRWLNLREATREMNQQNIRSPRKHNTVGFLGVKRNGKGFAARIRVRKKEIHIGTFPSAEQAHAAYLLAKRQLHAGCTI